jgi:hypothetical protein
MATVVNQPAESGNNGFGFLLGIIALIIVVAILFFYGLPLLQGNAGGAQVNLPSNANVNVGTK